MLNLSNWIYILKRLLKSSKDEKELREIIVTKCLASPRKIFGSYCVDENKVWENIISSDREVMAKMAELRIFDVYGAVSYFQEIQYKNMRATFPRKYHKKGA